MSGPRRHEGAADRSSAVTAVFCVDRKGHVGGGSGIRITLGGSFDQRGRCIFGDFCNDDVCGKQDKEGQYH